MCEVKECAGARYKGISFLTDFWGEKYFQEYIRDGGSKIKFITGRKGSGKTYFLQALTELADREGYKTAQFSARDIWMHDFGEIYREILRQCDICSCLEAASHLLVRMAIQNFLKNPVISTVLGFRTASFLA